jgi:hypothetical protein
VAEGRVRGRGGSGRIIGAGEHRAKRVVAGAALIADAAALQVAKARSPVVDGLHHFPIRFTAADTDDHVAGSLGSRSETESQYVHDGAFIPFRQAGLKMEPALQ